MSNEFPESLKFHVDATLAEGAAWKFAPPRLLPNHYELMLDNDCILWRVPDALAAWLQGQPPFRCLIAEDVSLAFGQFADLCGLLPRNSGLRGFPPDFDFEQAIRQVLQKHNARLMSELDEQGLTVAAIASVGEPYVVSFDDVTVCSPFPPHLMHLGRCGAHFVGLNAQHLPWSFNSRPATDYLHEHWRNLPPQVCARLGLTS